MLKYSGINISRNSWFKGIYIYIKCFLEVRNDLKYCGIFYLILNYFHITKIKEKYLLIFQETIEELKNFMKRINIDNCI